MAKKKAKAAKKKAAPKKAAKKRKSAPPRLVRTGFMTAFRAAMLFDPAQKKWIWPVTGQTQNSIAADFIVFADTLIKAGYLLLPPVPDNSGSLYDRLAKFILAQNWPVTTPIPAQWRGITPTVRLIEISRCLDQVLEGINDFQVRPGDRGGNPSVWPPH